MHDWVVWCKSKKGAEEIRPFELSGKEIFSNYDETKSKEEKNKKNGSKKKAHRGQSVRYRSWWKQGNIKMAVSEDHASCWVHKDLTVTTKQIQALLTAARASGGKDECQVRLKGIERKYWMGTKIGRLGGYGFQGTVTAGDGSNQKGGKMGAGYVNLRKQRKGQQRKGGTRRGRIQLEPSGTSGLCLGITWHPFDKTHAIFVRQPSPAESCKKMGR